MPTTYNIDFSGMPDENPFVHGDFKDLAGSFRVIDGTLKAVAPGASKIALTSQPMDNAASTRVCKINVGTLLGGAHDWAGPAFFIAEGALAGEGWACMIRGDKFYLYRTAVGSNMGASAHFFGEVAIDPYTQVELSIHTLPDLSYVMRCFVAGAQLGSDYPVTAGEISGLQPGMCINWENTGARDFSSFYANGLADGTGDFVIDNVNTDNTIKTNEPFQVTLSFSNVVDDFPILDDDFSSYELGAQLNDVAPPNAANGAKWTSARGDSGGSPIIVAGGYDGDAHALGFRFNPQADGYSWSEQRFNLCATAEAALKEAWVEYYIFWPNDFALGSSGNSNNKTFFLYSSQFGMILDDHYGGDLWSDCEVWPKSGSREQMVLAQNVSMGRDGVRQNWGHATDSWGSPPWSEDNFQGSNSFNPVGAGDPALAFWDKAADNGQWRKYQFYTKIASGEGQYDADFRVWKDGVKIVEIKESDFCDDTVKGFDSGYLFGWFNTGVAQSAVVKLSRCKMHSIDPQWGLS